MKNMFPNVRSEWREDLTLLNSVAWNELCKSPSAVRLLKYLYFCNKWEEVGKNKKYWFSSNNGKIVCSFEKVKEKGLIKSKQTYTNAVALLVTLGFVELTEYGGSRKPHMFRVLLNPSCKKSEQKWIEYPNKNWIDKIPRKNKKLKGGEKTYLKNFKPKGVGGKTSHKPNGIGDKNSHSLSEQTENINKKNKVKSNGLGSIIGDTTRGDFKKPILIDTKGETEIYQVFINDMETNEDIEWIGKKKYYDDFNKMDWKKLEIEK